MNTPGQSFVPSSTTAFDSGRLEPGGPDLDTRKRDPRGRRVAYRLPSVVVHRDPGGLCFTDLRDPEPSARVDPAALTPGLRDYFERHLSVSGARLSRQLEMVDRYAGLSGVRLLDVGVGPGRFLVAAAARGAHAEGLEVADAALVYCRERTGLKVHKATAEQHARDPDAGPYDAITLWDVLEHVNAPQATLHACARLLAPGGALLLETPCRDAAVHRLADLGYRLSAGRFTRPLEMLYGSHEHGHKQILSRAEVRDALQRAGLRVQSVQVVHQLAARHEDHLLRLTGSRHAAAALAPAVRALLTRFPVTNKVLAVARKPR
jgi:2-polyprenyl-6-hydroxyphenyl methylase/3-demethylubiquinone-9 3-methyltransferase